MLAAGLKAGVFALEEPAFTANHLYIQVLGSMHLARVGVGVREACLQDAVRSHGPPRMVRGERDGAHDDHAACRRVSYAQAGSGPVLLLIQGMAGNFENWQAVIEPLAAHHPVVAPDLPGHGSSAPSRRRLVARGARGFTARAGARAARVADFLERQLDISRRRRREMLRSLIGYT
jgi:pimeloyl-ACP methyl ester carboxylesterase